MGLTPFSTPTDLRIYIGEGDGVDYSEISRIGAWSETKLRIIQEYAKPYSTILKNQYGFSHAYIDAFAGAGWHISKSTDEFVPGSPLNALTVEPPFDDYYFVDISRKKIDALRDLVGERSNVHIHHGDSNTVLQNQIFPKIEWKDRRRALCLLDPYGLHLDWQVIQKAAQMKTIEIFLNFPTLDMNRSVLWLDPSKAHPQQQARMTRYWGDQSWRQVAYEARESYGMKYEVKLSHSLLAKAFRKRLQEVAGFQYVPDPVLMRKAGFQGPPLYYLFFASHNETGAKIAEHIFKDYRPPAEPQLF